MSMDRRDFLRCAGSAAGLWVIGDVNSALAQAERKWPTNNFFLNGNFGPVHEEVTAEDLPIEGQLPRDLEGMFVRNGPNPQFPPLGGYHWFDGDGMIHGVRLQNGRASYRNRWVRTAGWEVERKAGKAVFPGLLDPPDLRKVLKGDLTFKNTANTALVFHDGKLLALWEAGPPHIITVPNLETRGEHTYGGKLKHPFTAHPKVDPVTGEMFFFGYNPMMKPFLQYSVVNAQGQLVRTLPIDVPWPAMMHDFAVSAKHAIFLHLPETFDLTRTAKGKHPYGFDPSKPARFGVLPRDAADPKAIKWFEGPACFVFHVMNAYDEGEEVVVLACRFKRFPDGIEFQMADHPTDGPKQLVLPKSEMPTLHEWRFNLATGKMKERSVDDRPSEFPRINETRAGQAARFGYAGLAGDDGRFVGFVKYDLVKGTAVEHRHAAGMVNHGGGRFGGEGVFVPRPGATQEDDGWLLTFVHDEGEDKSELVVVASQDFQSRPVARIRLPQRVPYGFHGLWLDNKQLS